MYTTGFIVLQLLELSYKKAKTTASPFISCFCTQHLTSITCTEDETEALSLYPPQRPVSLRFRGRKPRTFSEALERTREENHRTRLRIFSLFCPPPLAAWRHLRTKEHDRKTERGLRTSSYIQQQTAAVWTYTPHE